MIASRVAKALLTGSVALAACADRALSVHVDLPPHAATASVVFAVDAGRGITLRAVDVDALRPALVLDAGALGAAESVRVWAFVYPTSLAALGLTEGPLARVEPSAETRPLPAGERLFSVTIALDGSSSVDWMAEGARSAELAALRIAAAPSPCPELDVEIHELDSAAQVMMAVGLADGRALVSLDDGTFRAIDRDGAVSMIETPGVVPFRGAHRDGDRLWLVGPEPVLATAHVDGARLVVETSTTIPEPGIYKWIAARGDDAIVVLTRTGELHQRAGGAWRRLHTFEHPPAGREPHGGVTEVAPGEWVATHEFTAGVVRVRDGAAHAEELPLTSAPRAVRHIPGLGTVVGTGDGQFLVHDGTGWAELADSPLTVFASSLQVYPGGFAYGGTFGNFGIYLDNYGFCPKLIPVTFHVQQLVLFGDDVLLAGTNPGAARTPFAILRPR
ncbi:hypothetical protein L6R52_09840 [Myxococcota bacterium]|nr:hypothetical protein [Myxococcota bacterium]